MRTLNLRTFKLTKECEVGRHDLGVFDVRVQPWFSSGELKYWAPGGRLAVLVRVPVWDALGLPNCLGVLATKPCRIATPAAVPRPTIAFCISSLLTFCASVENESWGPARKGRAWMLNPVGATVLGKNDASLDRCSFGLLTTVNRKTCYDL